MWQKLYSCDFWDSININVKLCMMRVVIELYPFIPLSATMIVFQGHRSVRQIQLLVKILCSYEVETVYDC